MGYEIQTSTRAGVTRYRYVLRDGWAAISMGQWRDTRDEAEREGERQLRLAERYARVFPW